jgi:hypothetical protein
VVECAPGKVLTGSQAHRRELDCVAHHDSAALAAASKQADHAQRTSGHRHRRLARHRRGDPAGAREGGRHGRGTATSEKGAEAIAQRVAELGAKGAGACSTCAMPRGCAAFVDSVAEEFGAPRSW